METEPFHGAEFEIYCARRYGKPVLLYRVGGKPTLLLRSFWELFEDSRLLPHATRRISSDEELLELVPQDLNACWSPMSPLYKVERVRPDTSQAWTEVPDALTLQRIRERLGPKQNSANLWASEAIANEVALIEDSRLACPVKHDYAALLAHCGNVWANRVQFDRAIKAVHLSIRYYMELGDNYHMAEQIICLSGIFNMANVSRARYVNHYGQTIALRAFPDLLPGCRDSRASILMTRGRWKEAQQQLQSVLRSSNDPSPYELSKYPISIAAGPEPNLELANELLFDRALSLARHQNRSLGYTLKWAAILSLRQQDFLQAHNFIMEGQSECLRIGNLHTLTDIRAAAAYYSLASAL